MIFVFKNKHPEEYFAQEEMILSGSSGVSDYLDILLMDGCVAKGPDHVG